MTLQDVLAQPCVIDTSLLTNFLYSGNALLLRQLLDQPVQITPVILDPAEVKFLDSSSASCSSEVLRPLFAGDEKKDRYKNVRAHILSFAGAQGDMWMPVELSIEEISLASSFRDKSIWQKCPTGSRKRKKGLGAGESEVLAVAMSREWTALLDDQAAVELLKCLAPKVPIVRTCALLIEAVSRKIIDCPSAEQLFNQQICGELLFNSRNADTGKYLRLRCNPLECIWEDI